MRGEKAPKAAQELVKNLISAMRNCKKLLDEENKLFDTKGISTLTQGKDKIMQKMQNFEQIYKETLETTNLKQVVPEEMLKIALDEYDLLHHSMEEYNVNLHVGSRITEMFMESMKSNITASTKNEMGYNKNGKLVSDKAVLEVMPSITFNSKV